jgi:hypothetical protein
MDSLFAKHELFYIARQTPITVRLVTIAGRKFEITCKYDGEVMVFYPTDKIAGTLCNEASSVKFE